MVSSADEKGLRHNRRHNSRNRKITLADVVNTGSAESEAFLSDLLRSNPEYAFLPRWGHSWRELWADPGTADVLKKLYEIWPRLTPDQRDLYLRTAESIAEAEKAKAAWNPKENRDRLTRLAKSAVAAAKLVIHLSLISPPPWEGENAEVGDLVLEVSTFVLGAVSATLPSDKDVAADHASNLLRKAKKTITKRTGGMRWELLRDLVLLASRGEQSLDERTVRRYLKEQPFWGSPVGTHLDWDVIREAFDLAGQWRPRPQAPDKLSEELYPAMFPSIAGLPEPKEGGFPSENFQAFRRAARRYLVTLCLSDISQENPA
jgi:hypothetical protein